MKKLLMAVAFCALVAGASAQKSNWVSLFDGKSLKGWTQKGGKAEFKVENGEIVGIARTKTPNSFLCTEKKYGDFILELEMFADDTLNSGIQFRSQARSEAAVGERVFGYQYEIDPSPRAWSGGIFDEGRRLWLYTLEYNQPAQTAFRHGQWNKIRIEAIGNSIRTFLNGVPCADILDDMTPEGFIALQVHQTKSPTWDGFRERWRNIRICTTNLEAERTPQTDQIFQINYVNNTLSPREKSEGWTLLFDGKLMAGWVSPKSGKFPDSCYDIENGELIVNKDGNGPGGNQIMTVKRYKNFAFSFDFFLTEGANNGIKYLFQAQVPEKNASFLGPEYQILDDKRHPDAEKGLIPRSRQTASMYDILPPKKMDDKLFKPIGQWNRGMIVVKDGIVQHYMNNVLVLEIDRYSYVFEVLKGLSKFADAEKFGQFEDGHLVITEHGDQVKFRNLKVKEF